MFCEISLPRPNALLTSYPALCGANAEPHGLEYAQTDIFGSGDVGSSLEPLHQAMTGQGHYEGLSYNLSSPRLSVTRSSVLASSLFALPDPLRPFIPTPTRSSPRQHQPGGPIETSRCCLFIYHLIYLDQHGCYGRGREGVPGRGCTAQAVVDRLEMEVHAQSLHCRADCFEAGQPGH